MAVMRTVYSSLSLSNHQLHAIAIFLSSPFFSSFSFRASFDNRGKENFLPFLVQSHTGNDYINAIAKPFAFSEKVSREVQL